MLVHIGGRFLCSEGLVTNLLTYLLTYSECLVAFTAFSDFTDKRRL